MKEQVIEGKSMPGHIEPHMNGQFFHSVEFSIHGLECLHQFKIWNIRPDSMCVLAKEDSEILGALKVGDIMPLKYYTNDVFQPTIYLNTEIQHIQKEEEGRFKGHVLIGLTILSEGREERIH